MQSFDVIVIGGGHAGCEAAAAAARRGVRVALVTTDPLRIGAMSCNPAIGGVGKGHLVRELDVFDGLMARAADAAAIHHRMLNRSKGAAVRGPRIQADRKLFRATLQRLLADQGGLTIVPNHVEALTLRNGAVSGIVLRDGSNLRAGAVVLATGTFLGGRLHCGLEQHGGGRIGETAAVVLAAQLREMALPMGRLKTGTPPRLNGRTIDWAALVPQPSDAESWTFSALSKARDLPQLACAITRTNQRTHDAIRAGLAQSPLYSGAIEGLGPRYCPSVEDKVVRFGDRDGHQIFLEPEGLDAHLVYPNGISTSLPVQHQQEFVRTIAGLERAEICTPGYAVEYDFIDPRSLDSRLALHALPGLFFAGQINGTTGYEEAAAQGLVAGLNAAAAARDLAPILFDRADSYIGVMVDDLTLQGVTEPYRMLTARAEYRLRLRADNAVSRLGEAALEAGISELRREDIVRRLECADEARKLLNLPVSLPGEEAAVPKSFAERAQRGEVVPADVKSQLHTDLPDDILAEALDDACYAPYIERQQMEIGRLRREGATRLCALTNYRSIGGLSKEMIDRLEAARPETLAAAGRIRGITPAALTAILVAATRRAA